MNQIEWILYLPPLDDIIGKFERAKRIKVDSTQSL